MQRYLYLSLVLILPTLVSAQTSFRSGRFLHHSTGQNIWGPNGSSTSIPAQMQQYNAAHGYTGSNAVSMAEQGWPLNPWENEWERWHRLFKNADPNANIQPILDNNRIVVIKSCFPSSAITGIGQPSDTATPKAKTIYNYKWHWRNIVNEMRQRPQNYFVIWTNAPLGAASTNATAAFRAKEFCTWAKDTLAMGLDPQFGSFPPNVYVFDYFRKIADANGFAPVSLCVSPTDNHPNAAATALIAPQFVNEIFDAAIIYEQGGPILEVSPQQQTVPSNIEHFDYQVTSNTNWVASSDQPWCSVTPQASGNATMTAVFGANTTQTRVVHITTMASGTEPVVVTLTQEGPSDKVLNIHSLLIEGLYVGNGQMRACLDENGYKFGSSVADVIVIQLRNKNNYNQIEFEASQIQLSLDGSTSVNIPNGLTDSYYLTIKHRNSIEITTAQPVSFSSSTVNYSFNHPTKVYGNQLLLQDEHYLLYSGDINQDGAVDTSDFTNLDNRSSNFAIGYLSEDINGDGIVDVADFTVVDNNAARFIGKITP
jgi:hypothetical protein